MKIKDFIISNIDIHTCDDRFKKKVTKVVQNIFNNRLELQNCIKRYT